MLGLAAVEGPYDAAGPGPLKSDEAKEEQAYGLLLEDSALYLATFFFARDEGISVYARTLTGFECGLVPQATRHILLGPCEGAKQHDTQDGS